MNTYNKASYPVWLRLRTVAQVVRTVKIGSFFATTIPALCKPL